MLHKWNVKKEIRKHFNKELPVTPGKVDDNWIFIKLSGWVYNLQTERMENSFVNNKEFLIFTSRLDRKVIEVK